MDTVRFIAARLDETDPGSPLQTGVRAVLDAYVSAVRDNDAATLPGLRIAVEALATTWTGRTAGG